MLAAKCQFLQTTPESPFVMNAVVQRRAQDRLAMMRGRTLKVLTPRETTEQLIDSVDEYVAVLEREFRLDLPEAHSLWPKIVARHEVLFGAKPSPGA